jgi:Uma2 family endonuclease
MRAVMPEVPQFVLDWRKKTGAEMWDEMWEGVLHMTPSPSRTHQDFKGELEHWMRNFWVRPFGNKVYHEINVASLGGWPNNYRIPDLVLLKPDCFHIDRDEYFEGAPTVVVEIRSPGDETMEKLPFYAQLGVPEVWVIDRDTKIPTLYCLHSGEYKEASTKQDGWLHSAATGIRFRHELPNKIAIQLGEDQSTRRVLPEA